MKRLVAAASSLAALTHAGPVLAQEPRVADGPALVASGTVLSLGSTSMAIRTKEHGRAISFVVSTTTVMPASVKVGSRVEVTYHAVGTNDQVADRVTLLEQPPDPTFASRESASAEPPSSQKGERGFLAAASLSAFERARF
jgi:hypothetical protein